MYRATRGYPSSPFTDFQDGQTTEIRGEYMAVVVVGMPEGGAAGWSGPRTSFATKPYAVSPGVSTMHRKELSPLRAPNQGIEPCSIICACPAMRSHTQFRYRK